jgi:phage recombination protein Bet
VGAKDDSILMVIDYCKARRLDPLTKAIHIVPMKGNDVIMAGIQLYRIQAARSGDMAGTSPPKFGPEITAQLGSISITYPDWCEITVTKLIGDRLVDYTAREYFLENYATKFKEETPNSMWAKRPRGQLLKCAESQALRKGWPEIATEPTYEEMVGKTERDITPKKTSLAQQLMAPEPENMAWFDDIIEKISKVTKTDQLTALYDAGVLACNEHNNTEAPEFIATACRQKEEQLSG